jgi:hypothetical protein
MTAHDEAETALLGLVPMNALQGCPKINVPPNIVIVLPA